MRTLAKKNDFLSQVGVPLTQTKRRNGNIQKKKKNLIQYTNILFYSYFNVVCMSRIKLTWKIT